LDKEITYRKYRPGDDKEIVEALQTSFPGWRGNKEALEYWRWKYLSSPLGAIIMISEVDGKIAAVHHDLILNVKVVNEVLRTLWSDDLSVLHEYRSMGLWKGMIATRNSYPEFKEVKFKYASSANPIVIESWKKRGFNIMPQSVKYMLSVKDMKMHLEKRPVDDPVMARLGVSLLKGLDKITPRKNVEKKGNYSIVEVDSFDERVDDFWDKLKTSYNFIVERKKEFLNWRSMGQTWWRFKRIIALDDNGSVIGYTVLKVDIRDEYHEGEIYDLLTLPGREDVAEGLIGAACEHFEEQGLNVAYFRCTSGHPHQKLTRSCFVEVPKKDLHLTYEIFTQNKQDKDTLEHSTPDQISLNYIDTF
jgi:hypothetical protein